MATLIAGDVLEHNGFGHLVLVVGVSKTTVTRLGTPVYEALVIEAGESPYTVGHVLLIIPEQPYTKRFVSRENSVE